MAEQVGKSKPNVRSAQHRYIPADTFGLRMSDNGAQVLFGLETVNESGQEFVQQEATVVLTLRSLKVLRLVLDSVVDNYEKSLGVIPIPKEKEDQLRAIGGRMQVVGAKIGTTGGDPKSSS